MALDYQLLYRLMSSGGPNDPTDPNYRGSWIDGAIKKARIMIGMGASVPDIHDALKEGNSRSEHQLWLAYKAAEYLNDNSNKEGE